jgi:alkanesulfonate monooxygenase SsuD/methylene tetrahydromethanopterin reductase-like flavin-dependent oxidoreductase (luciferase family)
VSARAADCIAGGRLQLGISRGSPEQVIDGWRYFGYQPAQGESDADIGHAEVFFDLLRGEGFAKPNPRPMFPNPPGLLRHGGFFGNGSLTIPGVEKSGLGHRSPR